MRSTIFGLFVRVGPKTGPLQFGDSYVARESLSTVLSRQGGWHSDGKKEQPLFLWFIVSGSLVRGQTPLVYPVWTR